MSEGPTLRQLRYFLKAVEQGSFAAAASAEHIAQPSLSEQIRRLERAVGARLFTRTNRKLQLTDVGRMMIPLAENTVRSADALTESVREARTLQGGTVSFGTFSSAHMYLLVPLTSEFHLRHPKVQIRLVGLNSSEVADAVRSGELEAGLVQLPVDDHGLDVTAPVLVDSVVYASADRRSTRQPVTIETLAERKLVLSEAHWRTEDPLRRSLAQRAQAARVTVAPFVEVEFQTAALELAANGVGDTLVSYLVARQHQFRDRMSLAPLDPPYEERYALIKHANASLSPATRLFMELARRHISALQAKAAEWTTVADHHEAPGQRSGPDQA